MKLSKKIIALLMSLMLIIGGAAGGTIAWITTQTTPLVNTFTVGDINIELKETTTDFKIVPGVDIAKDPKVTVKAGSEACWLFVKIDKSANFSDYLEDFTLATGWTKLSESSNVYYREVDARSNANNSDISFHVLSSETNFPDGYVTVKTTVTKSMLEAIKADPAKAPTLTFTAYAVQKEGFTNAADAWAVANP